MNIHCFFEQSGTFKNEFIKLGYSAYDYDIRNDFLQTDYVVDLFSEITKAYEGLESFFDTFNNDDLVMAFFPCVRFESQIIMHFQGCAHQLINKSDLYKLEYDLKLHKELADMYNIITKLAIVCLKKNLKLIIENPYSEHHYLTRYWCIKPSLIDFNRLEMGDYYKKPTQFYFINCNPKFNFIFEGVDVKSKKNIVDIHNKVERSLISPDYANRFIREFIL